MIQPPKAAPGDVVAVVSPSFAAPAHFPAVHEQAMTRLAELTGLVPREYPSTRQDSTPEERARDLNATFADPKPFCGYSDNTNILNWLWNLGIVGFYGGSTQPDRRPEIGIRGRR